MASNEFQIAVIGIACRTPRCENASQFWQFLRDKKQSLASFPSNRAKDIDHLLQNIAPDDFKNPNQQFFPGSYFDSIDKFDANFFGISPTEAIAMDPQHRMFMQTAWEAIEDAGLASQIYGSETGVYTGDTTNKYSRVLEKVDTNAIFGTLPQMIPSRLSYTFDLRGPTMVVAVGCSSSLLSVHLACQGLRCGDCKVAIAGGVTIDSSPINEKSDLWNLVELLNPNDQVECSPFDENAKGYVKGEGCSIVVLKPLAEAIKDGNHIYGVIAGSAANQKARGNGIITPNPKGLCDVTVEAWRRAAVDAGDIDYYEASGSSKISVDVVEMTGIQMAFDRSKSRGFVRRSKDEKPCLGAVTANVCHLVEGAAGVTSLIKVLLALKHETIPPQINFKTPNKMINWEKCPVRINTEPVDWRMNDKKQRVASVSSFGTSGTNVHFVVRDFKVEKRFEKIESETIQPVLLSAATPSSLKNFVNKLRSYLLGENNTRDTKFFNDLVYSLNIGRDHKRFNVKSLIFAQNCGELLEKLEKLWYYLSSIEAKPISSKCDAFTKNQRLCEDYLFFAVDPKMKLKAEFLQQFDNLMNTKFLPLLQSIVNRKSIQWQLFHGTHRSFLPFLPTYCFDEQRFWPETRLNNINTDSSSSSSSLIRDYVCISDGNCSDESEMLLNLSQEDSEIFNLWCELLGAPPTDKSHFFHCGGTTLLASCFTSKLRERVQLDIRLSHIYQHPTFDGFRNRLKSLDLIKPRTLQSRIDADMKSDFKQQNISSMQNGLIMLQKLSPFSTAYTENVAICGNFKCSDPETILKNVLERFPYLTSVIQENDSKDRRIGCLNAEEIIRTTILKTVSVTTKEQAIREARKLRPNFAMQANEPLIKMLIIEITDDCEANKMVVLFVHRVLVDDASLSNLEDCLLQIVQQKNVPPQIMSAPFDKYCSQETLYLNSEEIQRDLEIMSRSFETAPTKTTIGFSPENWSETKRYDCESIQLTIENLNIDSILDDLNIHAVQYFLSCYLLTLKRYTGENDLMTGILASTRSHTFQNSFGPFVNTVLFRTQTENETDLQTYFQTIASKWLQVQEASQLPLPRVLSYLRDERNMINLSLSNFFVFSDMSKTKSSVYIPPLHAKAPLSVFVHAFSENRFGVTMEWSPTLIDSTIANNFIQSFVNICKKIAKDFPILRTKAIAHIDVMSSEEYNTIMGFNRPLPPSNPILVHRYFEKHCSQNENKVAINSSGKSFTYKQLNSMANTLAAFIQQNVPEVDLQTKPIILMMERNELLFASILAVWKAGGFFVTISEDVQQKLLQIQDGADFDFLLTNLTQDQIVIDVPQRIRVENVNEIISSNRWSSEAFQDRTKHLDPKTSFAYVFYTSGTTGKPKRCLITHQMYNVYIDGLATAVDFQSFDVNVLQILSNSFDAFLSDFAVGLLCCCGAITVVPQSQRFDVKCVTKLAIDYKTSSCFMTPGFLSSVFLQLPKEATKHFRFVVGGAEEYHYNLYYDLCSKCEPETKIVNVYGLTETTIYSTIFTDPIRYISSSVQVPVGKPFVGVYVYIIDPKTHLLSPIGTVGEVCIAGIVVGKGDVKSTNFSFAGDKPVFLTGDGGRWLPDGNIDFIGRKSHNFCKILGFRVNPREIESVVLSMIGDSLERIRVFATEDYNNSRILCLVFKPKSGVNCSDIGKQIRNVIKKQLPYYMMPNIIKEMNDIPINSNGKTDLPLLRKACINEKQNEHKSEEIDAHLSEIVSILVKYLKLSAPNSRQIDVNCNFRDQGIHSFALMTFAEKLLFEKVVGFRGIDDLFNYPSIKLLAATIYERELYEKENLIDTSRNSCNETMASLEKVWKSVLNIEEVNEDDIFNDIGGDDSLAINMMQKVRDEIGVELELGHCYAYPSLKQLSAFIQELINGGLDCKHSNRGKHSVDLNECNQADNNKLQSLDDLSKASNPDTLLMFCGQGAQKETMFASLVDDPIANEVFKETKQILGIDILEELKKKESLQKTSFVQVALFIGCMAKIKQIENEKPHLLQKVKAVAGLSVGEFAALTFAGVISFEDALRLVSCRGKAMQKSVNRTPTAMANILGPNSEQLSLFIIAHFPDLHISGYLADNQHTVSGDEFTVDEFVKKLSQKSTIEELNIADVRKLRVSGAFHTKFMETAAFEIDSTFNSLNFRHPKIPIILNLNGRVTTDPQLIKSAVKRQLVSAVRWKQTIETAVEMEIRHFIELSPSPILTPIIRKRMQACIDSKCTATFVSL